MRFLCSTTDHDKEAVYIMAEDLRLPCSVHQWLSQKGDVRHSGNSPGNCRLKLLKTKWKAKLTILIHQPNSLFFIFLGIHQTCLDFSNVRAQHGAAQYSSWQPKSLRIEEKLQMQMRSESGKDKNKSKSSLLAKFVNTTWGVCTLSVWVFSPTVQRHQADWRL